VWGNRANVTNQGRQGAKKATRGRFGPRVSVVRCRSRSSLDASPDESARACQASGTGQTRIGRAIRAQVCCEDSVNESSQSAQPLRVAFLDAFFLPFFFAFLAIVKLLGLDESLHATRHRATRAILDTRISYRKLALLCCRIVKKCEQLVQIVVMHARRALVHARFRATSCASIVSPITDCHIIALAHAFDHHSTRTRTVSGTWRISSTTRCALVGSTSSTMYPICPLVRRYCALTFAPSPAMCACT